MLSLYQAHRRPWLPALWGAAALALGLFIVQMPLTLSAGALGGAALVALALWEPAAGVGLALALGPTKALLGVAYPALPADLGQAFFALALAGWLVRGAVRHQILFPRPSLLLPLGLYLAVGLFSMLPAASLEEGLKELLKWTEVALALLILLAEAERGRMPWVVAAVLLAGAAQAGVGLWEYQFRGTGPKTFLLPGGHYRAYGTFEQPNPYAGFLGLIWPVAAGLGWGWLTAAWRSRQPAGRPTLGRSVARFSPALVFFGLAGFMLLGLYVSSSRGGWLGAAAAGLVMALFLPPRRRLGLALVAVALAAGWAVMQAGLVPASITTRLAGVTDFLNVTDVRGINISDANFALVERLAHWQAAEAMIQAQPWLGVGLGNYAAAYPAVELLNWPNALGHAHNIYLNVWAETGLAGLAAYGLLWGWVIALTIRTLNRTRGLERGLALGLLGAWTHLSMHQVVDNLYVNNIHFLIAGLLALLVCLSQGSQGAGRPKQSVN